MPPRYQRWWHWRVQSAVEPVYARQRPRPHREPTDTRARRSRAAAMTAWDEMPWRLQWSGTDASAMHTLSNFSWRHGFISSLFYNVGAKSAPWIIRINAIRNCRQFAFMDLPVMRKTHQPEKSETSLVEQTRWPDRCYDEGKLKYPACIPEGLASRLDRSPNVNALPVSSTDTCRHTRQSSSRQTHSPAWQKSRNFSSRINFVQTLVPKFWN